MTHVVRWLAALAVLGLILAAAPAATGTRSPSAAPPRLRRHQLPRQYRPPHRRPRPQRPHAHSHADRDAFADTDALALADCHAFTDTYALAFAYCHAFTDTYGLAFADCHAVTDTYGLALADRHAHTTPADPRHGPWPGRSTTPGDWPMGVG